MVYNDERDVRVLTAGGVYGLKGVFYPSAGQTVPKQYLLETGQVVSERYILREWQSWEDVNLSDIERKIDDPVEACNIYARYINDDQKGWVLA